MTIFDDDNPFHARLRRAVDRFRGSLFGIPALWIVASLGLALGAVAVDSSTGDVLPTGLETTPDSTRALLTAIATGTIAAASVVFSLTLVSIQLATSAYSSRVLRTFLRDRLQQHVIGLLTATFAYSMIVLRAIREPDTPGTDFVPRIAVLVAVALAIASLLGLIGSINRTAQSLRVTNVTRRLVEEGCQVIDSQLPADAVEPSTVDATPPPGTGEVVVATERGWVQQIAADALDGTVDQGATVRLEVGIGDYVAAGTPLLTIWPPPAGADDDIEACRSALRDTVILGGERTMQQDVRFALVQVEDIILRALSAGIDDSNTARATIPQLAELVLRILERPPYPPARQHDSYRVLRPAEPTGEDLVREAFDQVRIAAADRPTVLASLADAIVATGDELLRRERARPPTIEALRRQLRLIEDACAGRAGADHDAVRRIVGAAAWLRDDVWSSAPPGIPPTAHRLESD